MQVTYVLFHLFCFISLYTRNFLSYITVSLLGVKRAGDCMGVCFFDAMHFTSGNWVPLMKDFEVSNRKDGQEVVYTLKEAFVLVSTKRFLTEDCAFLHLIILTLNHLCF